MRPSLPKELEEIRRGYAGGFTGFSHHKQRANEVFKIAISLSTDPENYELIAKMLYNEASIIAGNAFTQCDELLPKLYLKLAALPEKGGRKHHDPEHSGYYQALHLGIAACINTMISEAGSVSDTACAAESSIEVINPDDIGRTLPILTTKDFYRRVAADPQKNRQLAANFGKWGKPSLKRQSSFVIDPIGAKLGMNQPLIANSIYIYAIYFNNELPVNTRRAQMRLLFIKPVDAREPEGRRTHETLVHLGIFDIDEKFLASFIKSGADTRLSTLMCGEVITGASPREITINNGSGHFLPSKEAFDKYKKLFKYFFGPSYTITSEYYDSARV